MIQIHDLNFAYPRRQLLFHDLSMQLEAGSITGLLGKNGAGKTSLLKLFTGLLYPKSGNISVLGYIPSDRKVHMLGDIFLVPEEFYYPSITMKNYSEAYSPFYPQFDFSLLNRTLTEFELDENNNLQKLSHGQKKKFLIAFALATRCRILLLDEPTNGLDIPSKVMFRRILAGSLDENQLVIISTHQVKDVENLIDKIVILDNGKMIFNQTIDEISGKVCFVSGSVADPEGALYSEAVPGGYRTMIHAENSGTNVDIELLFNAIINGINI